MRHRALQTLTWGTVVAAVVSAFWLASVDLGWSEWRNPFANGDAVFEAPSESAQPGHHTRTPASRDEHGSRHDSRRNTR